MGSKNRNNRKAPTHQKKRKGSAAMLFISLVLVCLSVLISLSLTVLFKAKNITVSGKTIYSSQEIIEASGMQIGKNMFVSFFTGAEGKIETKLPYIGDAKIIRNVDGNVTIEVAATAAEKNYKQGEKYIYVNSSGKVLEIADIALADKPLIIGIALSEVTLGKNISYAEEVAEKTVNEIFAAAKANSLNITEITTDEKHSFLDVIVSDKYLVHLLDSDNIEYKILHLSKSLARQKGESGGVFTFSESNEGRVVFTPGNIHPEQLPENGEQTGDEGENSAE